MVERVTELFDVLDASGAPTGERKPRADVHRDGDWHRAIHVWVVLPGERVLLQRRSLAKDTAPGCIDVGVAGHLSAGETWREALREAREEIGLALEAGDVAFLETLRSERRYPNGVIDREFQDVFAVVVGGLDLCDFHLDALELDAIFAVPLVDAIALFGDGLPLQAPGIDAQGAAVEAALGARDLIAPARAQTLQSLRTLQRWLADPTAVARELP
jgi:isopentenyldiphosphate isomerase